MLCICNHFENKSIHWNYFLLHLFLNFTFFYICQEILNSFYLKSPLLSLFTGHLFVPFIS